MKKSGIPTYAWALLGFLVIASVLMLAGRSDPQSRPSITNYGPSGLAAWAELLRRDGYKVSLTRSTAPNWNEGQIPFFVATASDSLLDQMNTKRMEDMAKLQGTITTHIQGGGKSISASISSNFDDLTKNAAETTVRSPRGDEKKIVTSEGYVYGPGYGLWTQLSEGKASVILNEGMGHVLELSGATPMTNRFLARADNAEVFLDSVRSIAPKGSEIVFVETFILGPDEESMLESWGPWALAARNQVVFLTLVIIFTLGKKFGSPVYDRSKVRSSRELVDAVSDIFRRSKKDGFALELLYDDTMERLRIALKKPIGTKRKEILDALPEELREICLNVGAASVSKIKKREALELGNRLLTHVEQFEKDSRPKR